MHATRPAPGSPDAASPPQQSPLVRQVSPCTWHPDAGWQIDDPADPNGPQKWLQQVPHPLHVVPSTEQLVLMAAHTPTDAPTRLQTPVQQSASSEQISPTCVQYETCDGAAHCRIVPPSIPATPRQLPLQQSPSMAHSFPAVEHMVLSGVQVPFTPQIVLQQLAPDVHGCPSEMHIALAH